MDTHDTQTMLPKEKPQSTSNLPLRPGWMTLDDYQFSERWDPKEMERLIEEAEKRLGIK